MSIFQEELISTLQFWLMEEGIDGFVVSAVENEPESADFVHEIRAAFDGIASDTGKDRALFVRAGSDPATASVFYGSADAAGAHLVLNHGIVENLKNNTCKGAMGKCLANGMRTFFIWKSNRYNEVL